MAAGARASRLPTRLLVPKGEQVHDTNTSTNWRKSDFCGTASCVEVAQQVDSFLVRDSKNPNGTVLSFDRAEWDAFVAGVRAGNFDFV